jgi:pimeloyl-ACP methyl ester carboxylesterase
MTRSFKDIKGALAATVASAPLSFDLLKLDHGFAFICDEGTLFEYRAQDTNNIVIELRAASETWHEAFKKQPKPGFQSLGALYRLCDDFELKAPALAFAQALPTLEALLESARQTLHHETIDWRYTDDLSQLKGQYVKSGADWIYYETAGQTDRPVICMLHTAGADSRQWHGLMAMPELQKEWRMIAFDMPGHGRSPLPDGHPNWQWQLSEARYVEVVSQFIQSQIGQPVILMGCSMGAAIGLSLLAQHPALFRAAILLETPYHSPGRRSPFLDHPRVHGGRLSATWVASLLSPLSPLWRRNQARWIYSQGAPSVYDGDLAFYSDEFKAFNHTAQIDTKKTPLWLLTGDYDYSASPRETQRVANEIPGAVFQAMPGFGHFPMTEDPHRLIQTHLGPILSQLRQQLAI